MRNFVRSIALVAALAAPLSLASAQKGGDAVFNVGSKLLSVGVIGGGSGFGVGAAVAYEVGVKELAPDWTLGVGGFVGFTSKSYGYTTYDYTVRAIPIAAIGNVHYKIKDQPKVDVYGGLSIGFTNISVSSDNSAFNDSFSAYSSGLGIGGQVGVRYAFSPKVLGLVQLGGGSNTSVFLAGLSFKM